MFCAIEGRIATGWILYIAMFVTTITADISYNGPFLNITQAPFVTAIIAYGVKSSYSNRTKHTLSPSILNFRLSTSSLYVAGASDCNTDFNASLLTAD